jgi:Predicted nucleotidyltransferases
MLQKNEILQILRQLKSSLSLYGVSSIGLFGSSLRGDAGVDSDIDILIDFFSDKETYQNFISTCELLEGALDNKKLDVVTLKGLSPFIGKHILNEVEYV